MDPQTKLDIGIKNWVSELDKTKKCPYAKPVFDKNKIKTVLLNCSTSYDYWLAVYKEADLFDDTYDVVMVTMETNNEIITNMQMSGGIDSFNTSCYNRNMDIWGLNLYDKFYTMVLIQRLSKLDDASKALEKKDYYTDQNFYTYKKFILDRRELRKNLK